ncbi:unnamed protein product [Lampetra planeri]
MSRACVHRHTSTCVHGGGGSATPADKHGDGGRGDGGISSSHSPAAAAERGPRGRPTRRLPAENQGNG